MLWAYSTVPGELDGSIVIEGITYLVAGDCYQDDVEDEDYSREERSWQDDCEADDRGEARSTVTFGPIDSEVAPPSEKGEKGNDQTEKGEATGDGVEDKGGGQSLWDDIGKVVELTAAYVSERGEKKEAGLQSTCGGGVELISKFGGGTGRPRLGTSPEDAKQ